MSEPVMRRPTRWERIVFRVLRRWPESYVTARLLWLDEYERHVAERVDAVRPLEALREVRASRL